MPLVGRGWHLDVQESEGKSFIVSHPLSPQSLSADAMFSGSKGVEGLVDGWFGWGWTFRGKTQTGRVRTKTVKKASRVVIEKYYPRLTLDFQTNKRICDEVAIIASKRLRNKIAGFTTHLMKRIQKGPVRGISFKLQEEERERKDNYVPETSALAIETIEVDPETAALLKAINFESLPVQVINPQTSTETRIPGLNRGPRGPRKQE
ncbi:40S ribosomal protein S17 [Entophlyctis sp. JEL0112]|nr:40S ribosomal protein S17 [Entophlyctis sp. JEL0112]